jgi:hypothetical protein
VRLYSFKYYNDDKTYVGVMAQDLLNNPKHRDAVVVMPNGYYGVDYAKLGIPLMTLEQWRQVMPEVCRDSRVRCELVRGGVRRTAFLQ